MCVVEMTSKKRKTVAFECEGATEESSTKRKVATIECGGAIEESSAESGAPLEPPAYVYGSLKQFQKRQQLIDELAKRNVFNRPQSMGATIFAVQTADMFVYGRMSEPMVRAQKEWARNYLVSAWSDCAIRNGNQVRVSAELRLALSWYSGIDIFSWSMKYTQDFYFHLCRFGGFGDHCILSASS